MHIRRLQPSDLFAINRTNLDGYTETFGIHFYNTYITNWPDLCMAVVANDGTIAAYMLGKMEGGKADWHAHLSAISVATEFRGLKLTDTLLDLLNEVAIKYECKYIDLFVRTSNAAAISIYEKQGYKTAKHLPGYYSDGYSALELRKDL